MVLTWVPSAFLHIYQAVFAEKPFPFLPLDSAPIPPLLRLGPNQPPSQKPSGRLSPLLWLFPASLTVPGAPRLPPQGTHGMRLSLVPAFTPSRFCT